MRKFARRADYLDLAILFMKIATESIERYEKKQKRVSISLEDYHKKHNLS